MEKLGRSSGNLGTVFEKISPKNLHIIWDNAKFHTGKEIKNVLGKGQLLERAHLIHLPPHASDKNPIDHVWNADKGRMANIQCDSFKIGWGALNHDTSSKSQSNRSELIVPLCLMYFRVSFLCCASRKRLFFIGRR